MNRITNYVIPTVIESGEKGERAFDIYSRLLRERIVFVQGGIDSGLVNSTIAQLLLLEADDPEKDITMYVDSPGGSIVAGYALIDTMHLIKPDVATIVTGMAYSMGSVIAVNGAKGKRYMLPRAEHMIHQPLTGVAPHTQCSDIQITARHIQKMKDDLSDMYVELTNLSREEVDKIMDRDSYLGSKECLEKGIIDAILTKR